MLHVVVLPRESPATVVNGALVRSQPGVNQHMAPKGVGPLERHVTD